MQKKIKVYHFHNGSEGGVLSVIKNLVRFSNADKFESHIIYTINKDLNKSFPLPGVINASSEQIFNYSPKWNFYHTCKKMSQLLPNENAVIVANDWLELGMVSQIGLSNPVIQILHGDYDYYYQLAVKHNEWIDAYATVAEVMAGNLRKKIPTRLNDIYYLPFPVPTVILKSFLKWSAPLQIIFIGRLTKEKGYDLLPLIEDELRRRNIEVEWHIVGHVTTNEKSIWNTSSKVRFYGQLPNEKVIDIMRGMDCLLLPSLAEGMPVTVVEAMKVGLTCVVNDLPGGLQELIIDGLTGYKIKGNEVASYAGILQQLNNNLSCLKNIGESASAKANRHFDPVTNTARYEQLIEKCYHSKRVCRKVAKVYGSRLDHPLIPNAVVTALRKLF